MSRSLPLSPSVLLSPTAKILGKVGESLSRICCVRPPVERFTFVGKGTGTSFPVLSALSSLPSFVQQTPPSTCYGAATYRVTIERKQVNGNVSRPAMPTCFESPEGMITGPGATWETSVVMCSFPTLHRQFCMPKSFQGTQNTPSGSPRSGSICALANRLRTYMLFLEFCILAASPWP